MLPLLVVPLVVDLLEFEFVMVERELESESDSDDEDADDVLLDEAGHILVDSLLLKQQGFAVNRDEKLVN